MNYGDGWYGGVYVGAMYSLAFVSDDIQFIVREALKTIPPQSEFYQCIADVIRWHRQHPADWKQTWLEVQKKWADDIGCPDGVFHPFNIDAKVNAAYVVIGLLYGEKDFTKTLEISTRCGQDADCNPSTAGGILGTLLGYNQIPAYWKLGLAEAESIPFKYTTMSLNNVYDVGVKHAVENIRRNGGSVTPNAITIRVQQPVAVPFEKSFDGSYPVAKIPVKWTGQKDQLEFEFEGTGFVLRGDASRWDHHGAFKFQTELYIDGELVEKPQLPVNFTTRRHEIAWKYDLPKGKHKVALKILNSAKGEELKVSDVIVYSDKPVDGLRANERPAKSTAR
jgi:hypothetical protein